MGRFTTGWRWVKGLAVQSVHDPVTGMIVFLGMVEVGIAVVLCTHAAPTAIELAKSLWTFVHS